MVKVRDSLTGEIFDVPDSFTNLQNLSGDAVDTRISRRGSESFEEARQGFSEAEGVLQKSLAGLNVAAIPQERIEAGIANAVLALQSGNIGGIVSGFQSGVQGKKLGEIGDVFRRAGAPELVSATVGLVISFISPLALISKGTKALGALSKFTDKGIRKAGNSLAKGADDAVDAIGRNVDEAYKPINNIVVDSEKFIKIVDDLPTTVVKQVEKELGSNLDDLAIAGANIGDVRRVKQILGKLKPSSFGKETRGVVERIDDINVNASYARTKNLIQETLANKKMASEARNLLKADDAFSETIKSANFIKKQITDPTLLKATKAGRTAQGLLKGGDITTRTALNNLRRGGKTAKQEINKALLSLDRFNGVVTASRIAGKLTNYTILGGVAGSIGGKTASEFLDKDDRGNN